MLSPRLLPQLNSSLCNQSRTKDETHRESFSSCQVRDRQLSLQLHHLRLGSENNSWFFWQQSDGQRILGGRGSQPLSAGSQGFSQQEQSKRLSLNESKILLHVRLYNLIRKQKCLGAHIFICSPPCSGGDCKWFTRICKTPHDSSN